jgi:hypothetical protein
MKDLNIKRKTTSSRRFDAKPASCKTFITYVTHKLAMSEKPEERYKEAKKIAEDNIEQQQQPTPEPLDKQDQTEPVKAQRDGKAINITGSNAAGL